jgi:hypothetical protein
MTEKRKVELKPEKQDKPAKIMKHLSIDKTKIPLTDEEYEYLRRKFDEHIAKHGITFGFVYNLFLKDREDNE